MEKFLRAPTYDPTLTHYSAGHEESLRWPQVAHSSLKSGELQATCIEADGVLVTCWIVRQRQDVRMKSEQLKMKHYCPVKVD